MKTFEDIEELAMNEVIIKNFLVMHRQGTLTKEQALIRMVIHLTDQKNEYFNALVNHQHNKEPRG